MAVTRTQIILQTTSGIARDFVTNTWYTIDSGTTGRLAFGNALTTFYNALTVYFPSTLKQNGHQIKQYNMADVIPRAPVFEGTFNFTSAPTNSPLPSEVAICLSFQALKQSGIVQASRRGRVFLGPLSINALGGDGRPAAPFPLAVDNAATALLAASSAAGDWAWVVYSQKLGALDPGSESATALVENGWVDNAFDTQRRRGLAPSTRSVFP